MFGAEDILLDRCTDREVYDDAVRMLESFKRYFTDHGEVVYENPSPGNKAGGITTLEEKSLGCVQKGGSAPVLGVLDYGERLAEKCAGGADRLPGVAETAPGMAETVAGVAETVPGMAETVAGAAETLPGGVYLLRGPGNDLVSSTALAAAGAHLILFTTGRGTPFGCPVPVIKISSNTDLARKKKHWIDFDAGVVLSADQTITAAGGDLFELVLAAAGGRKTRTEEQGCRDIAIWKDGVTL